MGRHTHNIHSQQYFLHIIVLESPIKVGDRMFTGGIHDWITSGTETVLLLLLVQSFHKFLFKCEPF